MILPYVYYSLNITIIDFFLVFVVEALFFFFMMDKFQLRDNLETILVSSLLKIGFLSLLISWMPMIFTYTFKTVILFSVLLLFSGCVISAIIFRKD